MVIRGDQIMKRIYCVAAVVVVGLAVSACKTSSSEDTVGSREYHPVHEGYAEYLAENPRDLPFPHVADSVKYYMGAKTLGHDQIVRSAQFGRARVELGRILDVTMQAEDLQAAFGKLKRASSPAEADGVVLVFSLDEFKFRRFRSHLGLNVSAMRDGREILSRTYRAVGGPHTGGDVRSAGTFALKRSIQASTKDALDNILSSVIDDLNYRLRE